MKKALFSLLILFNMSLLAQKPFSPAKEALNLFNKYKPTIEKNNDAIVDNPGTFVGDINGDSLPDCLVYFVLTPKEGGNVIIDRQTAIYINTGSGMKVTGSFPSFAFCYVITNIKKTIIYLKEFQCGPGAPPYQKERKYRYDAGTVREIK